MEFLVYSKGDVGAGSSPRMCTCCTIMCLAGCIVDDDDYL